MNITTMQAMLPIQAGTIGGDAIETVDGRKVHAALESGKDYSSWVKAQIERARLGENKDFVVVTQKGVNPLGGRPVVDYHFTIEASKHIAMISGTDKGFEVRDYFIACEKKLTAPNFIVPTTLSGALRLAADQADTIDMQKAQLAIAEPKVAALNRIATAMKGSLCIRDAAKNLQVTEQKLKNFLFSNAWVYNREGIKGTTNPLAYAGKITSGFLEHKISGNAFYANTQVRVTAKGLTKISEMLAE